MMLKQILVLFLIVAIMIPVVACSNKDEKAPIVSQGEIRFKFNEKIYMAVSKYTVNVGDIIGTIETIDKQTYDVYKLPDENQDNAIVMKTADGGYTKLTSE